MKRADTTRCAYRPSGLDAVLAVSLRRRFPSDPLAMQQPPGALAGEIESEHRDEDRDPGAERDPRRDQKIRVSLAQHASPARRGRRRAEAEKRKAGLGENGAAHPGRTEHYDEIGMFGTMCRARIRVVLAPVATAATTKSRDRMLSTSPRVTRARPGVIVTPSATMTLSRLEPRNARITSASTSDGKTRATSASRIIT